MTRSKLTQEELNNLIDGMQKRYQASMCQILCLYKFEQKTEIAVYVFTK